MLSRIKGLENYSLKIDFISETKMGDEENGACMVNSDKSIEYTFEKLNQGLHASSSVHGTNTRARTFLYSCT